jgi:hypothetical protein
MSQHYVMCDKDGIPFSNSRDPWFVVRTGLALVGQVPSGGVGFTDEQKHQVVPLFMAIATDREGMKAALAEQIDRLFDVWEQDHPKKEG